MRCARAREAVSRPPSPRASANAPRATSSPGFAKPVSTSRRPDFQRKHALSQMEIDSVLAQIRSLSAQTRMGTSQATAPQQSGPSAFASLLSKGIDQVNQTQQHAAQLSNAFHS